MRPPPRATPPRPRPGGLTHRLRLRTPPLPLRRLSTLHVQMALAVSLTVHAALLTVRFVDPAGFNRLFRDTPLEVILVNARTNETPDEAQALAQANLAGGGDLAEGRATSRPAGHAVAEMGERARRSPQAHRAAAGAAAAVLLAQIRREMALLPPPDPRRDTGTPQEREQEERRRQLLKLLAEIEKRINDEERPPAQALREPGHPRGGLCAVLRQLRRRIEDTRHARLPQANGRKLYGELTMNITVDAAGRVIEAEIVRGLGQCALDRRAVAIVQRAGPFGPFNATRCASRPTRSWSPRASSSRATTPAMGTL
jgi:protein TonB